jgi:hypothetical protein
LKDTEYNKSLLKFFPLRVIGALSRLLPLIFDLVSFEAGLSTNLRF